MSIDKDIGQDIERTKKRAKLGCLTWLVVLVAIPLIMIILFIGSYSYEMYFKETEIETSYSSNETYMIKVVQKGGPFFHSPVSIRIYYGEFNDIKSYKSASISNDGAEASPDDIHIKWVNDENVTITLTGDQQKPETIEIDVSK